MRKKIVLDKNLRHRVKLKVRRKAKTFNKEYELPVSVSVVTRVHKDCIELQFKWTKVAREVSAQIQDFLREFLFKNLIPFIEAYLEKKNLNWQSVSMRRNGFKVMNSYSCAMTPG